jgi:crotonobetainyl-CoA:carnitine CoA-transferase CaiB-like acyl-CoA transferase
MLNYMATMHFLSGDNPYPIGNSHFVHVPYNTYKTSDGFIVIAVITDNFWKNLNEVVQVAEFDDPKYDGQPGRWAAKDYIDATLNQVLIQNTSAHWIEQLEAKRIPCAPVNKLSDALNDEQVLHRKMVVDLKHPNGSSTKGPGNPIKFSRTSEESFSAAPTLGQDTQGVLTELLNMSQSQIDELVAKGAISKG